NNRKKGSLDATEEILFDVNEMAKVHSYYNLSGLNVSEDNNLVSFGVDTLSRRKYDIFIKNLKTGEIYPERIPLTTGSATWGSDNKTLFTQERMKKPFGPIGFFDIQWVPIQLRTNWFLPKQTKLSVLMFTKRSRKNLL